MQNVINLKLIKNSSSINDWLEEKFNQQPLPLYSSVDLRNSNYKIAPVDANLFPAGFNNLNEESIKLTSQLMKNYIAEYRCNKVLIIPENYTRNRMYIENIHAIEKILFLAGFEAKIGLFSHEAREPYEVIIREKSIIKTKSGFVPEVILLNRDMTHSIPSILKDVKQVVIPNPLYGWHNRKKSKYFEIYQTLISEFCKEFSIETWLISALTTCCDNVDFDDNSFLETISIEVDSLLSLIENKYKEYGIKSQPYVFIKANNGTYGMGIITATRGELLTLNKKKRHKMKKVKEGKKISSVIIQEGISTVDIFQKSTAEPLIYYVGKTPSCYLYRYNNKKDADSSLNSTHCEFCDVSKMINKETILLWTVVSKLAVLALGIETKFICDSCPPN